MVYCPGKFDASRIGDLSIDQDKTTHDKQASIDLVFNHYLHRGTLCISCFIYAKLRNVISLSRRLHSFSGAGAVS